MFLRQQNSVSNAPLFLSATRLSPNWSGSVITRPAPPAWRPSAKNGSSAALAQLLARINCARGLSWHGVTRVVADRRVAGVAGGPDATTANQTQRLDQPRLLAPHERRHTITAPSATRRSPAAARRVDHVQSMSRDRSAKRRGSTPRAGSAGRSAPAPIRLTVRYRAAAPSVSPHRASRR